jgi:hypothetical protein
MICLIRFVIRPSLAKTLMSVIAVTAWLSLGTAVAGQVCYDVCIRALDVDSHFGPLSAHGGHKYCACEHRRHGRVYVQLGERELGAELLVHSQPKSVLPDLLPLKSVDHCAPVL